MLNPVTSQQLAIISTTVMSAREDFDFREEWEGVCSCIPIKGHFNANIYPKSLIGLSVPDCPLFGSHCTLSLWINGLAYKRCSAHIWVCRRLLLVGWLLGYVWVLCMRHVLNRAIQGWDSEGSLGSWDEPEADGHGPWGQPVVWRLWSCLFPEHAAQRPECGCLLLLRQAEACLGTPSWLLNTET